MLAKLRHSYFGRLFRYYLLVGVLLVALTGAAVVTSSLSSIQMRMREQMRSGVEAAAESVDALLAHAAETIRGLAADDTVLRYLHGAATRYDVARILYLSGSASPHIVRLSDGEIASTGAISPVFERENYNETFTLFRRFLEADDVAIYTTVKGIRMLPDTRVILAKAVRGADGAALGFVVAEISREALSAIASGYAFVSNLPIMLVDPYDVVLFSTAGEEMEGLSKLSFASDLGDMWATNAPSGVFEVDDLCWAKTDFARYAVIGEVSTALWSTALASTSQAVVPVLLLTGLLGIVFAYFAAHTVSAPIRRLTHAMREMEKGNFRAQVPVRSRDEIGRLSAAFNHMQQEIEELIGRNEEKQRSLRVAEVNALALQVNPHFLYNTLDLIKWSIKLGRPDDAQQVVIWLGKMLRRLMNNTADMVPVAEEMEVVRAFLEIQKYRHREHLDLHFDIDPAIDAALIPKLVLQPLIENAIVHGLENKPGGGTLRVGGRREGDCLRFIVEDNGEGMSAEKLEAVKQFQPNGMYNIGLSNVNQRARLYGDERCGLAIESVPGHGTKITLTLKYTEGGERICTR